MKNEVKHTAHSSYRCEYHIVFAPKYRRKEIYGQIKKDIGAAVKEGCPCRQFKRGFAVSDANIPNPQKSCKKVVATQR